MALFYTRFCPSQGADMAHRFCGKRRIFLTVDISIRTDRSSGSPIHLRRVLRKISGQLADQSMQCVKSIAGQEHEGTLAGDKLDSFLPAELDGVSADGAVATSSIHPDAPDARLGAISHHGLSDRW